MIGEKIIDYNPEFKLLLLTRNPVINIAPNEAGFLSCVNFTVTKSGLEGNFIILLSFFREIVELYYKP